MALEQNGAGLGNRSWQRHNCGTEGIFTMEGFDSRAFMIDASRGGFKLRFEQIEGAMAVMTPLPRDITVTDTNGSTFSATVLWAKDGLAGCRFYSHVSLDDVVCLMTGKFVLRLAKPLVSNVEQADGDASPPS
ncbi:PilZ domain-containing protein [Paramagnetospirillum kuznetsovii]|uniref:PilZ domain-containing protein n=1 Tax=Paramagnetospirillum kuznetsovii TaxID=2053833 RepID=A0A364NTS7_9PROT|nr:PilZ domain-containing protein [Paramagnetospirillum kuznetsovii]